MHGMGKVLSTFLFLEMCVIKFDVVHGLSVHAFFPLYSRALWTIVFIFLSDTLSTSPTIIQGFTQVEIKEAEKIRKGSFWHTMSK